MLRYFLINLVLQSGLTAPYVVLPPPVEQEPHITLPAATQVVEIHQSKVPLGPLPPRAKQPGSDGLVWVSAYWRPQPTASGRKFRPYSEDTCAHKYLPFGTRILLEYPRTGKRCWVEVTDRGPYVGNRKLDLTLHTYDVLGIRNRDVVQVRVLIVKEP
jgi:hypothetical protein